MDNKIALSGNELIAALNQQKKEQCAIFCARLNHMASVIRRKDLSTIEAADLLDHESESLKQQHEGSNL